MNEKEWVDVYNIVLQTLMEGEGRWQAMVPKKEGGVVRIVHWYSQAYNKKFLNAI